jgi:DNA-binding HxlR family transcriptional regulator
MSDTLKNWSYSDIQKLMPDINKGTLPTLLFRLKKDGLAEKVGRGLWKAVC